MTWHLGNTKHLLLLLLQSPLHGVLKIDMTDSAAVTAEVDRAISNQWCVRSAEALAAKSTFVYQNKKYKLERPRIFWQWPKKDVCPCSCGNTLSSDDTFPSNWIKVVFRIPWARIWFLFYQSHAFSITVSLKHQAFLKLKIQVLNWKKQTLGNNSRFLFFICFFLLLFDSFELSNTFWSCICFLVWSASSISLIALVMRSAA